MRVKFLPEVCLPILLAVEAFLTAFISGTSDCGFGYVKALSSFSMCLENCSHHQCETPFLVPYTAAHFVSHFVSCNTATLSSPCLHLPGSSLQTFIFISPIPLKLSIILSGKSKLICFPFTGTLFLDG